MVSNLYTFLRNKAFLWSLALCILLLPFQIKVLFFETPWGHGLPNPYTSFYVSAFDVALLLSGLTFILFERKKHLLHPPFFLLLFLVLAALSILLSPYSNASFHFLLVLKLLEILLFFTLLNHSSAKEFLIKIFILSMSFQGLWGLGQFLFQQDFGLQFLGESVLSASTANLARFSVAGSDLIRAYGTFPHPNILGGFLAISLFLTFQSEFKKNEKIALLSLQALGLLATFSRSAMLALLLALFFTQTGKDLFKKANIRYVFFAVAALILVIFFSLRGLNFFTDPALLERLKGYGYAWEMIKSYPLGVGFSHFTLFMDAVSQSALQPWEYQPVHNIFVLLLVELGIPFTLILGIGAAYTVKLKKPHWGLALMLGIMGLFDHYLLTQDQGRFLLIFIVAILLMKEGSSHKTSSDPK